MSYREIITIEPDKRGGKPCIRRMRITVYDVLGWLASGMSMTEIIDDFPELTETDIRACLEFVADRDRRVTRDQVGNVGITTQLCQLSSKPQITSRSNGKTQQW